MTRIQTNLKVLLLAAALSFGTGAVAQALKRLPPDFKFPEADVSPGPVTFKHATHVDPAKPVCTTCHPSHFRILEAGKPVAGPVLKHAEMEKGAQCGACHGKTAFGFKTCEKCHAD